jgi:hypothetical protein
MSIEFVLSILNLPWEICTKKLSYTKGPLLAIEHKGPQKKVLNKSISNYVVKNFFLFHLHVNKHFSVIAAVTVALVLGYIRGIGKQVMSYRSQLLKVTFVMFAELG